MNKSTSKSTFFTHHRHLILIVDHFSPIFKHTFKSYNSVAGNVFFITSVLNCKAVIYLKVIFNEFVFFILFLIWIFFFFLLRKAVCKYEQKHHLLKVYR